MIRQESKVLVEEHEYDDSVAEFLRTSPDFFERNPELLMELSLPHHERGAISLVERRLALHREQYGELRERFDEIVEIAHHNDQLGDLLHEFSIGLMSASSLAEVFNYTEKMLIESMACEISRLMLYRNSVVEVCAGDLPDFVRLVDSDFGRAVNGLHNRRPVYCGYATRDRRRHFFADTELDVQSLAVLRLNGGGQDFGYLAIGSQEKTRFAPHKGTDFLLRFGSLLSARLAVFYD